MDLYVAFILGVNIKLDKVHDFIWAHNSMNEEFSKHQLKETLMFSLDALVFVRMK